MRNKEVRTFGIMIFFYSDIENYRLEVVIWRLIFWVYVYIGIGKRL